MLASCPSCSRRLTAEAAGPQAVVDGVRAGLYVARRRGISRAPGARWVRPLAAAAALVLAVTAGYLSGFHGAPQQQVATTGGSTASEAVAAASPEESAPLSRDSFESGSLGAWAAHQGRSPAAASLDS